MSVSISFHGPYTYAANYYAPGTVEHHRAPYSSLTISDGKGNDVTLFFSGRDGLDGLIKDAFCARDQWPAPAPEPEPACMCTDPDCPDPVHQEPVMASDDDDGPPPLSRDLSGDLDAIPASRIGQPAPLPPYAEPPGIAHCAPGDCTCGGHVDAAGVFHAAVAP